MTTGFSSHPYPYPSSRLVGEAVLPVGSNTFLFLLPLPLLLALHLLSAALQNSRESPWKDPFLLPRLRRPSVMPGTESKVWEGLSRASMRNPETHLYHLQLPLQPQIQDHAPGLVASQTRPDDRRPDGPFTASTTPDLPSATSPPSRTPAAAPFSTREAAHSLGELPAASAAPSPASLAATSSPTTSCTSCAARRQSPWPGSEAWLSPRAQTRPTFPITIVLASLLDLGTITAVLGPARREPRWRRC